MRRQIMDKLRMAGSAVRDMDADYAHRVGDLVQGPGDASISRQVAAGLVGSPLGSVIKSVKADTNLEKAIGYGSATAIELGNFGARYALPTAGVTLAGQGLIDIAAMFGGPADVPQATQLQLM